MIYFDFCKVLIKQDTLFEKQDKLLNIDFCGVLFCSSVLGLFVL